MQVVTEEQAIEAVAEIKQGATLTHERKKLGLGSTKPCGKPAG